MPHAGTALLIVTVAAQTNPDGRKSYVVTVNGREPAARRHPGWRSTGGSRMPPRWSRRGRGDQDARGRDRGRAVREPVRPAAETSRHRLQGSDFSYLNAVWDTSDRLRPGDSYRFPGIRAPPDPRDRRAPPGDTPHAFVPVETGTLKQLEGRAVEVPQPGQLDPQMSCVRERRVNEESAS